ncbi:DNA adenine methylase [Bauldia sp.]|uniref:DNA adenine methylase n=1 Tax=Bauldia sp. TaxID=2575872 RepID=UPI003BAC6653
MPKHNRSDSHDPENDAFTLTPVPRAKPVAGYVGGKKQLAKTIVARIETIPHGIYGEVFAGMGGVFFRRTAAPKVEALNDISRDVACLFRVLQNHYQAFLDMLKWQVVSRAEFERLLGQDPERLTDLQRAARFLYVQRLAFGGKVAGRNFGVDTQGPPRFDLTKLVPLLEAAHDRLQGVWIECLDWRAFLDRWDRPEALFYLDPPYHGSEHYYGRGLFDRDAFAEVADRLAVLKGRFILTVNDVPETRAVFDRFTIESGTVTYTLPGHGRAPKRSPELIVTGGGR